MEAGQYVLHFRPKEALHCAPIWAKDYRAEEDGMDGEDEDAESLLGTLDPFTTVVKRRSREEL